MKLKDSARIAGLRPETLLGMFAAHVVHQRHGWEMVITSCTDGQHSAGSLHYLGLAFDLRTRDRSELEIQTLVSEIKDALGSEWDVVRETLHIHCEFQPKTNRG